ncbi:MAG: hypothetical protein II592_03655, partial [Muribaculaceae bacterium]|nr:hypothetical protein [Muribaculaceae bacterium]
QAHIALAHSRFLINRSRSAISEQAHIALAHSRFSQGVKSETWRCAKHIVECTPEVYAPLCDSDSLYVRHVVDMPQW